MTEVQQLDLPLSGGERKEQGQERTWGAQSVTWQATALIAVEEFCRRNIYVTGDDVRRVVPGNPDHPNAWGALMGAVAKKGWVSPTTETLISTRPEAHARRVHLWTSNLYEPDTSMLPPPYNGLAVQRRAEGVQHSQQSTVLNGSES